MLLELELELERQLGLRQGLEPGPRLELELEQRLGQRPRPEQGYQFKSVLELELLLEPREPLVEQQERQKLHQPLEQLVLLALELVQQQERD